MVEEVGRTDKTKKVTSLNVQHIAHSVDDMLKTSRHLLHDNERRMTLMVWYSQCMKAQGWPERAHVGLFMGDMMEKIEKSYEAEKSGASL